MSDDLERRIRSLPWRTPSAELKDKIFAGMPDNDVGASSASSVSRGSPSRGGRRVTLQGAFALATAAGFLGFIVGAQLPTNQPAKKVVASTGDLVQTDIRIVETSSPRNSFDFSASSTQILPGEFIASLDAPEETTK